VDEPSFVLERNDGRSVADIGPAIGPACHLERSRETVIDNATRLVSTVSMSFDDDFPRLPVCSPAELELEVATDHLIRHRQGHGLAGSERWVGLDPLCNDDSQCVDQVRNNALHAPTIAAGTSTLHLGYLLQASTWVCVVVHTRRYPIS
jgi:hypothetical protein